MQSNPVKADVYEQITNAIVSSIEEGAGKYEMPWYALSTPLNATNRKPYRGVNVLMLWATARKHAYASNEWATYRQWQEAGVQVRRGERSTTVVFWKFYDRPEEEQEDSYTPEDRPRCFARYYHVFNASQVDGYTAKTAVELPESVRVERLKARIASSRVFLLWSSTAEIARSIPQRAISSRCRRLLSSNLPKGMYVRRPMSLVIGPGLRLVSTAISRAASAMNGTAWKN
jgi:antirestriction protein ArdC